MLSDKISQQNITFEQLCDNFINYKTTQLKAWLLKDFKYTINSQLKLYFKNIKINKVNIPVIEDFQRQLLKKDYSNSYTKNIQSLLNRILNHAVRRLIINKNLFDHIEFVKHKNKKNNTKIKYWTHDQYQNFRRIINNPDNNLLFFDLLYYLVCESVRFKLEHGRTLIGIIMISTYIIIVMKRITCRLKIPKTVSTEAFC